MLYYLNHIACLVKLYALHLHHQNKKTDNGNTEIQQE